MRVHIELRLFVPLLAAMLLLCGCANFSQLLDSSEGDTTAKPEARKPEVIKFPIVVRSDDRFRIPVGSRIVIADVLSSDSSLSTDACGEAVKSALMIRLVDNSDYVVVTRDHLDRIIGEIEQGWAGQFDTRTAANLGKLLSASLWIVGRVAYCGQSVNEEHPESKESQFNLFAILQVIDVDTGEVLASSASEGSYIPRRALPLQFFEDKSTKMEDPGESSGPSGTGANSKLQAPGTRFPIQSTFSGVRRLLNSVGDRLADWRQGSETISSPSGTREPKDYVIFRAAEEVANGFADKFFARPTWEEVEMWHSPGWAYSEAIRLVQLGQCPQANEFMEQVASKEISRMSDRELHHYLHNYGVTLLCSQDPQKSVLKLRSAYRLKNDPTTERMLGLANKVVEWSLQVEIDQQPEIRNLLPTGADRGR